MRAELAALAPDVILAHGNGPVSALRQATRTVPIVFPVVGDPVGAGFVDSLARPGGNATGFTQFEFSMSGKWLELLKQIAPDVRERRSFGIRPRHRDRPVRRHPGRGAVARRGGQPDQHARRAEIEHSVAAFARAPNGGLIVTASRRRHSVIAI